MNDSKEPLILADGCTTTPATLASIASKRVSAKSKLDENQAGAAQRNRKDSAWTPDLPQNDDQFGANSAPCYAKPNDNKAKATPHGQTNGNKDLSPESCTALLDWHAPCHAQAMLEHQTEAQEQVSKRWSKT